MFTHCHRSDDNESLLQKRFAFNGTETASGGSEGNESNETTSDSPTSDVESRAQAERAELRAKVARANELVRQLANEEGEDAQNLRNRIRTLVEEVQESNRGSEFAEQVSTIRSAVAQTLGDNHTERMRWSSSAIDTVTDGITALRNIGDNPNALTELPATFGRIWAAIKELIESWKGVDAGTAIRTITSRITGNDQEGDQIDENDSAPEGGEEALDPDLETIYSDTSLDNIQELTMDTPDGSMEFQRMYEGSPVTIRMSLNASTVMVKNDEGNFEPASSDAREVILTSPLGEYMASHQDDFASMARNIGEQGDDIDIRKQLLASIIPVQKVANESGGATDVVRLINENWERLQSETDLDEDELRDMLLNRPQDLVQGIMELDELGADDIVEPPNDGQDQVLHVDPNVLDDADPQEPLDDDQPGEDLVDDLDEPIEA